MSSPDQGADNQEEWCKSEIERMLRMSQTKVIFPLITLGLLQEYQERGQTVFLDSEVRKCYHHAVRQMEEHLGHNLHIGGKYYDAYPARNLPRYGVLKTVASNQYGLQPPYLLSADSLIPWIPDRIKQHIREKIGVIPLLGDRSYRAELSTEPGRFVDAVAEHIDKNPTNFEIFSFAVIRVHLEKFACKVYRDTRTSAHDGGVDLSTNFGVVYQIKQLKILTKASAETLYAELRHNFDTQRLDDGNVILVIDDISKDMKQYLIDMKVQAISKNDLLKLTAQFEDMEDREKVLRIVHDEFRREYQSTVKPAAKARSRTAELGTPLHHSSPNGE